MQEASERVQTNEPIFDRAEVKEQVEKVRAQIDDLDARTRRLVQERPIVAVGVALVVGYALGRLMARR
jgi:ElaB/YqjD/DUF883 family membrane-anchored ribosome-binding protein